MEITTKAPEIYEVGKSATLQWTITYTAQEIFKHTFLYLNENGSEINLVSSNGGKSKCEEVNKLKGRCFAEVGAYSVYISITDLRYGDFFNFSVEAFGQTADFKHFNIMNKTILIQNVKGMVILSQLTHSVTLMSI